MTVPEAPIEDGRPVGAGWFVVNLDGAAGQRIDRAGQWTDIEAPDAPFEHFGINVHVVQPGQANAMYHAENNQEDFLVLSGECIVVIEEEERRLRAWDFVHCPPGTRHVFVGAGDGPCAILMVGARLDRGSSMYPPSEVAARHGASAADPEQPYAEFPDAAPVRFSWPPER
jgi:uncharacterized cupin superfamily protein